MLFDDFSLEVRKARHHGKTYLNFLDVLRWLRAENPDRLISHLDPDEKITLDKITGRPEDADTFLVTEGAVFKIAIRMRSRAARAFLRFVCHDILPAVRECGTFSLPTGEGTPALIRDLRTAISNAAGQPEDAATKEHESLPW